jgi:peptidoglycan/LPS O-acetylase OafA/YrhL
MEKYRAEIDGLRAVAVVPVILFHAGIEQFSGGYVGVDIFFVISGYLITTIILTEMGDNTFSLVSFYDRRARRILPALFLVMLLSSLFAWFWLMPADMKDFSQSLVAVPMFSSNILFWQETGYWGTANEIKPLLHTWSLAVEEQYYVIFPIFLMLMWGLQKHWLLSSFILLAVISLAFAQWGAYTQPSATFFLLPSRAWELLIGACIAFYFLYRENKVQKLFYSSATAEVLSFIGLILIGYSVFIFDEEIPFPSIYTLLPTLGTGLIILFASRKTLVGKFLGSRIPVGIGLISYSAYLWHQPLFAFARQRSLTQPAETLYLLLAILTFLLAYISWKYVEKPFRVKGLLGRRFILWFGFLGSAIFILFGYAGHITDGFNSRSLDRGLTKNILEEKRRVNYGLNIKCDDFATIFTECSTDNMPEVLIWGDSYAMHLVDGIVKSTPDPKVIQMTKSYCGPFFGIAPVSSKYPVSWAKECLKFSAIVREWLIGNKTIKYVVVSSPFTQYLSESNKLLSRGGGLISTDITVVKNELLNTLDELKSLGIIPIVFSPPPATGVDLGRCLAKAEWFELDLDVCDFDVNQMSQTRKLAYQLLDEIGRVYHVIRLDQFICNELKCNTHYDSTWLFRDKGHLSRSGSIMLGEKHRFYELITRK